MSLHQYGVGGGSPFWGDAVATFGDLPTGSVVGELRLTIDTGNIYEWNGAAWVVLISPSGYVTSVSASSPLASSGGATPNLTIQNASAVNTGALTSTDWSTFNGKQPAGSYELTTNKGAISGYCPLDVNQQVPIANIPPAALERLVIVADAVARHNLTIATVQNGDTVKQSDTGEMWYVFDDTQLNVDAGYRVYTAGTATAALSVPWSGVSTPPTTVSGYGITDLFNSITVLSPITGTTTKFSTLQAAFNSIPAATSNATARQVYTVYVPSGTYDEDVVVQYNNRRIVMVCLGSVALGALSGSSWGAGGTPRNFTIDNNGTATINSIRSSFGITSINTNTDGSTSHESYMSKFRISGNLVLSASVGISSEFSLEVEVFGNLDASAYSGNCNVYMRHSRIRGTCGGTTFRLQNAYRCQFEGLVTAATYGKINDSVFNAGFTTVSATPDLTPSLFSNTSITGTFTGPASSLRLDLATDYYVVTNAVTLAGGATKVLVANNSSSTQTGVLTSTDWSTFNNKEPAIGTKNTAFNKNYGTNTADVKMNGSVSVGAVDEIARIDHIHATDTSRAASTHATQHYPGGSDPVNAVAYHGFENRTSSTLVWTDSTPDRTLTITGTFNYYYQGNKITVSSSPAVQITNTVGLWFIYFNSSGTLTANQSFPAFSNSVLVATVYWNGTVGVLNDERHNYTRNLDWHSWAHNTVGTRYGSGLDITNTGTGAAATFSVSTGTIYDEDIAFATTVPTTQCRLWYQTAATAPGFTVQNALSTAPFIWNAGTSRVQYVNAAGPYTLVDCAAARYVNYWVYGTTGISTNIWIHAETIATATTGYTTVAAARAVTPPTLSLLGLPPEMKLLYRLVVSGAGVVQAAITADDYRNTTPVPSGGVPATTASAVTFAPVGNIASVNVQSALEELDTEKQASLGFTPENVANKSTDVTMGGLTPSNTLYPSQLAAKTYIDANAGAVDIESKSANFTAATKKTYFVDTTSAAIAVQLPAPTLNVIIAIKDSGFNSAANNITLVRAASEKIENVAATYIINSDGATTYIASNGTDWFIL